MRVGPVIGALTVLVRVIGMAWANPLLLVVPLVGLSGLTGWHIMHERSERNALVLAAHADGVREERMAWEQAMAAEASRQKEVGDQALAQAKAEINRLEAENTALAAAAKEWDHEADSEPSAGERCLSDRSRVRLNRIR